MRGRQAVAVAWRRASRLRAAAALVSDSGTQDQKTSVDLRAVHLAGVGAETPEVPLGVGGREAPGAVVLVAEASDDGGADGHGSVVEGVGPRVPSLIRYKKFRGTRSAGIRSHLYI